MANQTITGKAFEYSLLRCFHERLASKFNNVNIIENAPYLTAKECYLTCNDIEQGLYNLSSSTAVNFLIDIEPRLSHSISEQNILQLEIVSDSQGQTGDVRDVLAIRLLQKWEIGISAKNNHRAVKHSRLSNTIDFGAKWLGLPCSKNYFKKIKPIFDFLEALRVKSPKAKWSSIDQMHLTIYKPILDAFKAELLSLDKDHAGKVPLKLVEYLMGRKDFYKIIKGKGKVEIQAYNLYGTLNKSFARIKPKAKIQRLKLPSRLIEVVYDKSSSTTLIVTFDEGWQISFRIHNAKSTVESSLKFDINLISAPCNLFATHILVNA